MSEDIKSKQYGSLEVTNSTRAIGAKAPLGRELYRVDESGQPVEELVGYDYNREVLKQMAVRQAERTLGRSIARNDAAAIGIEHDLVERDTKIWEEERAALTAASFVPMDPSAGRFSSAKEYEWLKKEMLSDALVKAHLGGTNHEIPSVNASMSAQRTPIWNVLTSYELTVEQEMFGGALNFNFGSEFAAEGRLAILRKIDEMLLLGDSSLGIEGLYNSSDVTVITPTNNDWYESGNTPAQILAGIEEFMSPIRDAVASSSVTSALMPDTVIMSDRLHAFLSRVDTFGSATDRSTLQIIKERYPEMSWDNFSYELRDAGASAGLDRMIVYKKDPSYIKAALPVPYQERPVLQQAYSEVVHAYARFVPVIIHDKRPVRYVDIDIAP